MSDEEPEDITDEVRERLGDGDLDTDEVNRDASDEPLLTLDGDEEDDDG